MFRLSPVPLAHLVFITFPRFDLPSISTCIVRLPLLLALYSHSGCSSSSLIGVLFVILVGSFTTGSGGAGVVSVFLVDGLLVYSS